ncbi:MAG: site-specific DNA-methyltransferase [Methanobrevibacter sp.]|jgi:DNA modification methylase|nr:site-specific DNA-methyltransferase [Candidatus Methanovirga australis]
MELIDILKTNHQIIFKNSQDMEDIISSINLVVTSPPYPMIGMWDELFTTLNPVIGDCLSENESMKTCDLMHEELNKVWSEIDRVLVNGGIVCINIGDATRKIGDSFQLYSNHSKIIQYFEKLGYQVLPPIIWRKQSNKPNKFMGSGMLPPNAYVTLEHEYILIFRKKGNRSFSNLERDNRQGSAYFWEERNLWFSDLWEDIKGTSQKLNVQNLRDRNGAYPFELAHRLINMYSVKGDTILDPFLGTGTTTIAAMTNCRNSICYEIDVNFKDLIEESIIRNKKFMNKFIQNRLNDHLNFVNIREKEKGKLKHKSNVYGFSVMTSQEKNLVLNQIAKIVKKDNSNEFEVEYENVNKIEVEKYKKEIQTTLV